jgi:hypothetical protein
MSDFNGGYYLPLFSIEYGSISKSSRGVMSDRAAPVFEAPETIGAGSVAARLSRSDRFPFHRRTQPEPWPAAQP